MTGTGLSSKATTGRSLSGASALSSTLPWATYSPSTFGMPTYPYAGFETVFGQPAGATVSGDRPSVIGRLTIARPTAPASQQARPREAGAGRRHHTSSSLPVSLRSGCAGPDSSLSALSDCLPRSGRLVRYTVSRPPPPRGNLFIAAPSSPASNDLGALDFRAARLPCSHRGGAHQRSAWLNSTR